MVHSPRYYWGFTLPRLSSFITKNSYQTIIARIKIQMAFRRIVEVGLFKHKWHAQNPLPEVQSDLTASPSQSYMMQTLRGNEWIALDHENPLPKFIIPS
jgi:hypothetical protein